MNLYKATRLTQWAGYESLILAESEHQAMELLHQQGITDFYTSDIERVTDNLQGAKLLTYEANAKETYEG